MKELEYFLDQNNYLYCYDNDVEFFAVFLPKENKWVKSKISFTAFSHDYDYKDVTYDEACKICNNIFPDDMYFEYIEMLFTNGGLIKKRHISIFRIHYDQYKDCDIELFIDGKFYNIIKDDQTLDFELDFKSHIISYKAPTINNLKTFILHVPYGIDSYLFTLEFKNNELLLS